MESRIERLCVEHGLKMTGQRRVIARVLSDSADHPDVEERADVLLVRQVGADDRRVAELVRDRLRALAAAVVVDDELRAFRMERACRGGADAAGRAGAACQGDRN